MNNLMKAEWFRLRRSGSLLSIILLIGFCSVALQFLGNDGPTVTVESYFLHASMGIAMAVGSVSAIVAGTFNNRLANYEIMKGTPPMTMILSKTLMTLIVVTVIYFIPSFVLLLIYDSSDITLPMILLTYVCVIKLTVISESVCIIAKDGMGAVMFLLAFAFESVPLLFLQNVLGINAVPLTPYLTSTQLMIIGDSGSVDLEDLSLALDKSYIEAKVLVTFIIFTAVMFGIAYKSLKNKWETRIISAN